MEVPARVYVGTFSLAASLGVVFALLAAIQDDLGFADATLGLIAGSAFFAAVAAQLWLAPLADRGHGRSLVVGAVALAAVASFWFAYASTVPELVAARVLAGVAVGAFQPTARALVSAADPGRAGERLGRLSAVETAGFVSGPAIGAAVNRLWGLDAPFVLLGVVLLALVPSMARLPVVVPPAPAAERKGRAAVAMQILGRRQALAAVLLGAALFLPAGMYEAIWARFLEDLGATTLFVGVTLTMYGLPFAISAAAAGRFIDRYGPWRLATIALVIVVPLTVVYGQMRSPWLLLALAMVEAVGNGIGLPASFTAMAAVTGDGERATGQGLVAAAGQVGAGLAALLAAPLYAGPGPGATFAAVAAIVAVLGFAGLWLGRTPGSLPPSGAKPVSPVRQ